MKQEMDDDRLVPVSPRHSVRLAREFLGLVDRAPQQDYLVRTIARREANGLHLMSAEIVIAGRETRERYPLAARYPLHFRKTFSAARLQGDPAKELESQTLAGAVIRVPLPIGASDLVFRSCLVPGRPYSRLSPFGTEPEQSNLRVARDLQLAEAAGLWHLLLEAFDTLTTLHRGGLAHGDAELHNFVVCPSPLEMTVIDFESAVRKQNLDNAAWEARCAADLAPLLREAVFVQCALGRQVGALADTSLERMPKLLRSPDPFRRAIEEHEHLDG